ncbi:MAG TPA: leucyl aminopeptidase family protein [Bdellovibrionota bacterium]|nr:leucyl aminopeptidase family protein [Bdellovibrionota bacterium]
MTQVHSASSFLPAIRLSRAADWKAAEGLGVLIYFSDDQGAAFRRAVQGFDPALASALEKELELDALKGGMGDGAWFQAGGRTYYVASLGATSRRDPAGVRVGVERVLRVAYGRKPKNVALYLDGATPAELRIAAEAAVVAGYRYDTTKSERSAREERTVTIVGRGLEEKDLTDAHATGLGTCFARELAILPASHAYPTAVVQMVKEWSKGLPLEIKALNREECRARGLGSFLSVAAGSANEPQMLIIHHKPKGAPSGKRLGFVGKGVIFDTGGYNLKVGAYKDLIDMKADMGGAAAVCGAMMTVAKLNLPIEVVGVCGLTDNMISGTATHPGDVVKAMTGKTIEIQNTDAEGRLVLADAVAVAKAEGATHIVDVATLTAACAIALGGYFTGLMSNDKSWSAQVAATCNANGEPVWELPLYYRHLDELKSDVADLSNMGKGREGGAMLAATFIRQFVGDTPWVHLDIAGSGNIFGDTGVHGTARYSGVMASSLVRVAQSAASR